MSRRRRSPLWPVDSDGRPCFPAFYARNPDGTPAPKSPSRRDARRARALARRFGAGAGWVGPPGMGWRGWWSTIRYDARTKGPRAWLLRLWLLTNGSPPRLP